MRAPKRKRPQPRVIQPAAEGIDVSALASRSHVQLGALNTSQDRRLPEPPDLAETQPNAITR